MPIKRFADFLHRRGELQEYMDLLVRNFNKDTVANLMCLDTISVGWDGKVSVISSTRIDDFLDVILNFSSSYVDL